MPVTVAIVPHFSTTNVTPRALECGSKTTRLLSMKREVRPELVEFGNRLRELRGRRGLTQEQLAHQAGVDRAWISSAETGRRNASLLTLYRLAEALEIDPGELIIGTSAHPR